MKRKLHLSFEDLDKDVVYRIFQAIGYHFLGLDVNGEPKKV